VGIDLCKKLIQIARANVAGAGLTGWIQLEVGNAAKVRFNDASFDMVLSTGMLHSLKDPLTVFREVNRLLKKGGVAWIYDPANVSSIIDKAKWRASLIARERFFLALYKLLGLYRPIAPYTKDQVVPLIKAAGFRNYDVEEEGGEIKMVLQK
jgi:ubiquinone/menaquinone biosynthesis C-methylase UbiE